MRRSPFLACPIRKDRLAEGGAGQVCNANLMSKRIAFAFRIPVGGAFFERENLSDERSEDADSRERKKRIILPWAEQKSILKRIVSISKQKVWSAY